MPDPGTDPEKSLVTVSATMTRHKSPDPSGPRNAGVRQSGEGDQDPWAAFGYMVAGVAFYGAVGYVLGRWLDAGYLLPIGIVVGAMFGMYMVFARYRYRGEDRKPGAPTATPIEHDRPHGKQADRDDRGDT
jgi:hypothetical protein